MTFGSLHFQCVYISCIKETTLLDAYKKAIKEFKLEIKEYMPHLSLVYGDFEIEEKQKMVKEAVQRLYGEKQK